LSRVICDLNSISIGSGTFDKVFCISVLEHLGAVAVPKVLDEFYKALRPGGQAIISFDIPDISVRLWKTIVDASKLQFHPEIKPIDFDEPENVLTSPRKFRGKFLKCFCNVLVKPE
jgi:SAM-dependent methyltransferase